MPHCCKIYVEVKQYNGRKITHSNVYVDNISVTQWSVIWNSVACNIVNWRADGLRESTVKQRRWIGTSSYAGIMCNDVNFISCHSTSNSFTSFVQHLTSYPTDNLLSQNYCTPDSKYKDVCSAYYIKLVSNIKIGFKRVKLQYCFYYQ